MKTFTLSSRVGWMLTCDRKSKLEPSRESSGAVLVLQPRCLGVGLPFPRGIL